MNGHAAIPSIEWNREVLASIVVFLVALPLSMGIAIASGAPPAAGLITGIVGGLVVGVIAGCPLQVSGPAAGLSVIVYEVISHQGIETLAAACFLAGLIQLLAGSFKVGQWFRAVPPAVIHGMLAGIGVLIVSSQLHVMLDAAPRASGVENLLALPADLGKAVFPITGSSHHLAGLVGSITILALLAWPRIAPRRLTAVPAAIVAVVLGSAAAAAGHFSIRYVEVPSSLISSIRLPDLASMWSHLDMGLLGVAMAMAMIASAETLLSAGAVDQLQSGPRTNYDRELMAQGIGNMVCGLMGGLPMTGVIARSKANVDAGARTRWSAVLHGLWMLAIVALFPGLLKLVPVASLAAVLVYTGCKLVDRNHVMALAEHGRMELAIYFATLVAIVGTDLLKGVLLGLVLAAVRLLLTFTHLGVWLESDKRGRQVTVHLEGAATFLKLPQLASTLESVPGGLKVQLDMQGLGYVDHACQELLHGWTRQYEVAGGHVSVTPGQQLAAAH